MVAFLLIKDLIIHLLMARITEGHVKEKCKKTKILHFFPLFDCPDVQNMASKQSLVGLPGEEG